MAGIAQRARIPVFHTLHHIFVVERRRLVRPWPGLIRSAFVVDEGGLVGYSQGPLGSWSVGIQLACLALAVAVRGGLHLARLSLP